MHCEHRSLIPKPFFLNSNSLHKQSDDEEDEDYVAESDAEEAVSDEEDDAEDVHETPDVDEEEVLSQEEVKDILYDAGK